MSVISNKDKKKVVAVAQDGTKVTGEMIHSWCADYDQEKLPKGYEFSGSVAEATRELEESEKPGRPPLFGERMSSITIKIPIEQKKALQHEAQLAGASLSSYVRNIITTR